MSVMTAERKRYEGKKGCTECMGPIGRTAAEELWFKAPTLSLDYTVRRSLETAHIAFTREDEYLRVPMSGSALPVLDIVGAALDDVGRSQVKVGWLTAGNRPEDAVGAAALRTLEGELERRWLTRLLDERRLYMHFQPIVSLRQPIVYAHEALVRATEQGRELSGFELVSAAVNTGLIVPFDARTRVAAIEQFSASAMTSKLFINFQPSAIYNPRYCLRTTFAALEQTHLVPEDIVFEIVESEEIGDMNHLRAIIKEYRDHGLGIAMDDFGAGHSTIERLKALQPDYVKLDKSMTDVVTTDAAMREEIATIVRLAHDQGCKVIGEGIETVAQHDALKGLGIEFGQGYLYARPSLSPQVVWP